MAKLTLVRGLPGSGKSTYAKTLQRAHYEADQFFELDWGEYVYDRVLIEVAHDWCYSNAVRALRNGHDVVVSNTFTAIWEMERYLSIPTILPDVEIDVIEMKTQYESIHNIPPEAFQRMRDRWVEFDADKFPVLEGISVKQIVV